ncbi:MAG: DUF1501 domain-containing protein [Planctomycetaceae bacterium]|nr:DUF1501 domain-containing protein [Planctomycetaceae bacterium]
MSPSPRCSGPLRRREFLRAGALALGGITLSDVLAQRAAAGEASADTTVILFWMWGGPSQLETYDMKPEAPSEYRGPLNPIRTNVPGIEICEYMPLQAQMADKFSIIRSLHHEMSAHNDGSIEVLTGKTPSKPDPTSQARSEHPDFGMIASQIRGPRADGLPQYVGVQRAPFMTMPTYLGVSQKAFDTGDPSVDKFQPPNLTLAADMEGGRFDDRKSLITQFDHFRRDLDQTGSLGAIDQFRASAFNILTSTAVADAFDLTQETDERRDRYGRHRWGQSCLLARRLAEAGVAVINVDATAPNNTTKHFSWDDHAGAFHLDYAQRERLPQMDQALTALVSDLYDRGLDERVLVIACGEFGRTPKVTHAPTNFSNQIGLGRDHWPNAFSAFISGGGLRMGQVIGQTNSKAEYPLHNPVTPQDLLATVYHHLHIDPTQTLTDFAGRPVHILPSGKPIAGLV